VQTTRHNTVPEKKLTRSPAVAGIADRTALQQTRPIGDCC